jgi:hypothetical protein
MQVLIGCARALQCNAITCIHQVGQGMYPLLGMISPENLAKNVVERYAFTWIALLCCRMKYYFAWKVGAVHTSSMLRQAFLRCYRVVVRVTGMSVWHACSILHCCTSAFKSSQGCRNICQSSCTYILQ